jgi:hypothetical protein
MRENPYLETTSNKKSFLGKIESFLRKAKPLSYMMVFLLVALICITCLSLAASFGVWVYHKVILWSLPQPFSMGLSLVLGYLAYGLSLMVINPLVNHVLFLPKLVKPFRGNAYSLETMPWYLHNALIYLVRYTFLELMTPSPLNVWFYRGMGMKIGKGVVINTTNISDACLITLGDYVVIGGSAHLLSHYSAGGYLIVSTLEIGSRTTVGLKATVFGGSTIGKNCTITPHSVVLPKSTIADGTKV